MRQGRPILHLPPRSWRLPRCCAQVPVLPPQGPDAPAGLGGGIRPHQRFSLIQGHDKMWLHPKNFHLGIKQQAHPGQERQMGPAVGGGTAMLMALKLAY